jgi:hypothetical protein
MSEKKPRNSHLEVAEGRELDPERRSPDREHAAQCPECAAKLWADDLVMSCLKTQPPDLPDGFVMTTCAKAIGAGAPTAPLWWVSVPLTWRLGFAALFVLAALAGFRAGASFAAPKRTSSAPPAPCCNAPELAAMRVELCPVSPGGRK